MAGEAWLDCQVSEGQFPGEVIASGDTFDGEGFSLFCGEEQVQANAAVGEQPVSGRIKVVCLDRKGNLVLVKLPQPALENGFTITVRSGDLHSIREPQRA